MSGWFVTLQQILPKALISRAMGSLGRTQEPWLRDPFMAWFASHYKIDLSEYQVEHLTEFATFNDFFTRALKPDARPIDSAEHSVVSPADGAISQIGAIEQGQLLQAKGIRYSLAELAPGEDLAQYQNGRFATIYLAPNNYHRVHSPLAGQLTASTAIPGELFSVNGTTAGGIANLFCRNERLVCRFTTPAGDMLLILVGALIVASIETVFDAPQSPYRRQEENDHRELNLQFAKGDEVGRFLLGSTAIMCFPEGVMEWDQALRAGDTLRMGQAMGQTLTT